MKAQVPAAGQRTGRGLPEPLRARYLAGEVAEGALVAAATKRGLPDGPDEAGPSPPGAGSRSQGAGKGNRRGEDSPSPSGRIAALPEVA